MAGGCHTEQHSSSYNYQITVNKQQRNMQNQEGRTNTPVPSTKYCKRKKTDWGRNPQIKTD